MEEPQSSTKTKISLPVNIYRLNDFVSMSCQDALNILKHPVVDDSMKRDRLEPLPNSTYICLLGAGTRLSIVDGLHWSSNGKKTLPSDRNIPPLIVCRYFSTESLCKRLITLLPEKKDSNNVLVYYSLKPENKTRVLNLNESKIDNCITEASIVPNSELNIVDLNSFNEDSEMFIENTKAESEKSFLHCDNDRVEPAIVHSRSPTYHHWNVYYNIMINNSKNEPFSSGPPVNPKPGDIYFYKNEKNPDDWKADQYAWEWISGDYLPKKNPVVYTISSKCLHGPEFKRRAWFLLGENRTKINGTVIIHYIGSLENVRPLPHGNRTSHLHITHVPTAKSQLKAQREMISYPSNDSYKKLVCTDVNPCLEKVLHPRDQKQVQNTKRNELQKRLLSKDDIIGVCTLASEVDGFIDDIKLFPDFHVIMSSNRCIAQFKDAIGYHGCYLTYDTTFSRGDFYLSVLSFVDPIFENVCCENPVLPVMYMIHHEKKRKYILHFLMSPKKYVRKFKECLLLPIERRP